MRIQPYLFFEGRCEEAAAFYKAAIGAEVTMLMRFKDAPPSEGQPGCAPGTPMAEKVMHMSMDIGGATVMASDGRCSGTANFAGVSLSLQVDDAESARRMFDGLAEGGEVRMPLGATFFSPAFGMVSDKFGVTWMVMVGQ